MLVLLYTCEQTTKCRVFALESFTPPGERVGVDCKRTIVLASFVWFLYYANIFNIIILFCRFLVGKKQGNICEDFYGSTVFPQREMVQHLSHWGDSFPLTNTKNFRQWWLLLSPHQTSVALGCRFQQGDSDSEFCLSAKGTDSGHRLMLGASSLYLLSPAEKRKNLPLWLQVDCDELRGCPAVDP